MQDHQDGQHPRGRCREVALGQEALLEAPRGVLQGGALHQLLPPGCPSLRAGLPLSGVNTQVPSCRSVLCITFISSLRLPATHTLLQLLCQTNLSAQCFLGLSVCQYTLWKAYILCDAKAQGLTTETRYTLHYYFVSVCLSVPSM